MERAWIGGQRLGSWFWSDKSAWAYVNWKSGEPNNKQVWLPLLDNPEFCIEMIQSGEWTDRECGTKKYFVCKKPIPTTANGTNSTTPPTTEVKPKPTAQGPTIATNDTAPKPKPTAGGPIMETNDTAPTPAPTDLNHLRLICQTLINPALNPLCQMLPNDYSRGKK